MQALILADGDAPIRRDLDAAWPGWDRDIGLVIAADGGARHAAGLAVSIDAWVGDGDSIGEAALAELTARGIPIERTRPEKDESDTELAVLAALGRGATGIVVIGALGGPRIDHTLANVGLLALPALADRPAILIDAGSRISLVRHSSPGGSSALRGARGHPWAPWRDLRYDVAGLRPFANAA